MCTMSAGRLLGGVFAQPEQVCKRGDVLVSGRSQVRESWHHRVGRGGYAELVADQQRQRGSERVVVKAATVTRAGREARRLAGPVAQQIGKERSDHRRSVLVGVGGTTQFRYLRRGPPYGPAEGRDVAAARRR